jgi:hypothetical protein
MIRDTVAFFDERKNERAVSPLQRKSHVYIKRGVATPTATAELLRMSAISPPHLARRAAQLNAGSDIEYTALRGLLSCLRKGAQAIERLTRFLRQE